MSTCADALPALIDGAHVLGIELDPVVRGAFVTYCEVLAEANSRMNLTALRTPEGMMTGLFLDALTCLVALPPRFRNAGESIRVVDVGAGAGLPGIPLRLLFPHWRLTLIESTGKKARFLEMLVRDLALDNVDVLAQRAETVAGMPQFRDRADLCLARAVAPLPTLLELCAPLVTPGGSLIFPKGREAVTEVKSAAAAAAALQLTCEAAIPLPDPLSHLGEGRVLVRYGKTGLTPPRFPRRVGLARTHPISAPSLPRRSTRGSQLRPE